MLSEYPCVPFMCPMLSIVFCSQGIPIEPTNVCPTNVTGTNTSFASTNNNLNLNATLTDIDINLITGIEGRTITYYASTGEYRFIDLRSNRPLSDISIKCMWKDKLSGSLHNLDLASGGAGSLKLLFRKKNFYTL